MRTFAQRPKPTQPVKVAEARKASLMPSRGRRDVNTFLRLQSAIGNEASQHWLRLATAPTLERDAEEAAAEAAAASNREEARRRVEHRTGEWLEDVPQRADAMAAIEASRLGARAFTSGGSIAFGGGQMPSNTPAGRALLGHELAHVAQQRQLGTLAPSVQVSPVTEAIDGRTSWGNLDESALGADLLAAAEGNRFTFCHEVLEALDTTDRDDVSLAFMEHLSADAAGEARLEALVASDPGRRLLDRLFDELTSGSVGEDEQRQADRIIAAKGRAIPAATFVAGLETAMIFPYRLPGLTVLSDAPISAERRPGGRVWVKQPVRVLGTDEFRRETRTLAAEVFIDGVELPEDTIVGVKMYDLGGEVRYRTALYLVQLSNETDTTIAQKAGEAAALGLTLGTAGLAAEGPGLLARTVVWLDRIALTLGTLTSILSEHRGWITERFGNDGRTFLRYVDMVNSVVIAYGGLRAVVGVGRLAVGLSRSFARWRAAARSVESELSSTERAVVRSVSQETEQVIDDMRRLGAAEPPEGMPPQVARGGGAGPAPERQRVLVVGAETEAEFRYAREVAGRGHEVTVANPRTTEAARAYAEGGGHFIEAPIETLPRSRTFELIREDYPFPIRALVPPTEEFAAGRLSRLAPGGRWIVTTEAPEFSAALEVIGRRTSGITVTVREVPIFHEGTPVSEYPEDLTRFILIFELAR